MEDSIVKKKKGNMRSWSRFVFELLVHVQGSSLGAIKGTKMSTLRKPDKLREESKEMDIKPK